MIEVFECPGCHKTIAFRGKATFCAICGATLERMEADFPEAPVIMPDCPDEVGRCECDKCEPVQKVR
jgi:hypothetical protein